MTAVIYARYSSDSQREASIEGQLRDCKDYAEKNGITVVGTYIDRAYSAKTDDRPDFQRMIKDSAKKIFDVVLVWKLDRFARNRFDAVNYKYQLEKNGVHLVSAMEPISQGPEGIMVESMLIGMAEYYSAELALKVARGERENALQCKYNGGVVPLGFTIGKEDRLYHIDPETAPIVQEIFTRYADGEPAEKIAASLNERGLRTRTGKPFVKNSFFQIFRNRRYIGEYRYKDIVTPGGIPAIVDKDLFDRVQQRFEQNKIAHGRPAKEDVSYLLTTKLFCGKCGTLMGGESGTSHMGNTYYYYKCGNAKRHGKAHCDLKAIRKEPLERFVVDTAIKVIFSDEIIERLIDLVMEAQQQENTRLPVLKEQLRDTEKRLANLLEAIEQGILTSTTKQRLDELEARKEALNTSILEEELKKPVLTREWIRFWLEKFRKGDVGSTEHQRQIIDTFVNSVYVFDDRVVLNFNFTDDAKTVTREEVLGSSAVDNAPPEGKAPHGNVWCFLLLPTKGETMSYAIVFSSKTGNTKLLADTLHACLPQENCCYFGTPDPAAMEADDLYVGFWTDKGNADESTLDFLKQLHGKNIFLFGTAGFGGSEEYFNKILKKVEGSLDRSNTVFGRYMCQGKMPLSVRQRYEGMKKQPIHLPNLDALIENFDNALSHPDAEDLERLKQAVK